MEDLRHGITAEFAQLLFKSFEVHHASFRCRPAECKNRNGAHLEDVIGYNDNALFNKQKNVYVISAF